MTSTSLVVPCFNEEHRLEIAPFIEFGRSWSGRFVFVDDGSVDGTARLLDDLMGELGARGCEVLTLPTNRGKGEAVRHGVLHAFDRGADLVGFWDSDLATPLDVVPVFEAMIERGECDVVLAARVALLGRDIQRRRLRHYVGRVFATAASAAIGLPVYDTQCGAKMFRATPAVREAFSEPFESRWVFDVEILARLAASLPDAHTRIYEWPLDVWRDVDGSKLKPGDYLKAGADLWKIRRSLTRRGRRHREEPPQR